MANISHRSVIVLAVAILISISLIACKRADKAGDSQEPRIEASPVEQGEGQWKITTSDAVSLTVTAPGAQRVKVLYRPIVAEGRHVVLKTLNEPTDPAAGKFSTELKAAPDFAGHVWAEISYADGTKKKTEAIALTTEASLSPPPGQIPLDSIGGSVGTDESERSDKITGGKIEQTSLLEGEPRVDTVGELPNPNNCSGL